MNNDTPADAMELKPCPFCGEHCGALVVDQGDKWAHYEPSCLEVRTGYDLGDNAPWRAELSAAWNRRTTSLAAQDGLVEALREAQKMKSMTDEQYCDWKTAQANGKHPCTRKHDPSALVEALRQTRDALRKLQPALNVMAQEIIDDIITDKIERALT